MSEKILRKAKEESDSILEDSRKNAHRIIENVQKEAAVYEGKVNLLYNGQLGIPSF